MECDFNNLLRRYTTGTIPFELKKIIEKTMVFSIIFSEFGNYFRRVNTALIIFI